MNKELEIRATQFSIEGAKQKMEWATSQAEKQMYAERIEYLEGELERLYAKEEVEVEILDEQDEDYPVLNLSECGRFETEYDIPEGYELSESFMTWKEANEHIAYLKDLNRDPSYTVSILGYYLWGNDDYVKVVSKVRVSFS